LNITNRMIAAYLLWHGKDGDVSQILGAYNTLRGLFDMKPRDLELRRYRKIQAAMCSEALSGIVQGLMRGAKKAPD